MEENISRFVTAIIAIFILFVFPVYTAYEKKDDISYALAVRYTQDFVDNVRKKGYITQELYNEYAAKLLTTGNTYEIELEHEYVRYDGDYVDKTVGTATRNIELFTSNHILNLLNDGQIYKMNVDDNFNVKIKNTNVTLATIIYNIVTVNASSNNVRIYVDYGGKILAEKWYADNLLYSKYGGLVEDGAYKINVSIDNSIADDEDGIVDPITPGHYLANEVKIGDYVEYYTDPTKNSYTIYYGCEQYGCWKSGCRFYDTTISETLNKSSNIYWRVLDVKNGSNVVLISEDNALSHTFDAIAYSTDYLSYEDSRYDGAHRGYYQVKDSSSIIGKLNAACESLFSYPNVGTARNLTKDDLAYAPYNVRKATTSGYYALSTASSNKQIYFALQTGSTYGYERVKTAKLRPVVELNENVLINYNVGGCRDTSKPCGTKENPWLISMQTSVTKLGDVADVGEFVNYVPDKNADGTTKSITIPSNISGFSHIGYSKEQTFQQTDAVWRVLENDGNKVTLISNDITDFAEDDEKRRIISCILANV